MTIAPQYANSSNQLAALKEQLAKARALRWPVGPRPQPMTHDEIKAARAEGNRKARRAARTRAEKIDPWSHERRHRTSW